MIVHVCLLPNKVWFDLILLFYQLELRQKTFADYTLRLHDLSGIFMMVQFIFYGDWLLINIGSKDHLSSVRLCIVIKDYRVYM